MNDLKELKRFLIGRFLIIVIATAAAEAIIFYALEHTVFKALLMYAFHTDDISQIGLARLGVAAPVFLIGTIISLVSAVIPRQMVRPLEIVINSLNKVTAGVFKMPDEVVSLAGMSFPERLLLTLILVAAAVFIVLPYAAAAIYYSRIVVREFKKIEERETAQRDEYERRRNLMLSDIAHDLRTPMTTISGYAQALDEGLVTEERKKEICASIRTKAERMNDLIGFLFDYVKLDSEGFALEKEKTDICELVRECVAFAYQDIEDAGMELDIDIPEKEVYAEADRLQLSRAVTNLITNAMRHNEAGAHIGIYMINENGSYELCVCDDGDPIDDEYAAHIFEPFVTGDESRRSGRGTGLGLSIVNKIVTMHGYEIKLLQKKELVGYRFASNYTKSFRIKIPAVCIISQ